MLLQTGVLLLFCVAASMCATLVNYQTPQKEVDATSPIVAASEEAASPPAAEKPEPNSFLSNDMSSEIHAVEKLVADRPEVDVSVADGAGTDSDRPAGDTPSLEAFSGEAVASKQPSSSAEEDNDIRPIRTRSPNRPSAQDDSGWSLKAIRNSFQTVHGYFDSLVELAGGHNGVCQYRCRYGKLPQRRPGYQLSHPDGCSYSLMGFQLDLGIPAMTKCCNELDVCYETCGTRKYDCDSEFRLCLHGICSDINKSLGFSSNVEACGSAADALYNTVWTLGCPSYMNSQRAACICDEEERDEL